MQGGIKKLIEGFWALSRVRQDAFLKNLYDQSPQNKDLFKLRLGKDTQSVMESLQKEIQKETINRIGKFRKLRLSKINTILRNTTKYGLPVFQQMEIKKSIWTGMLAFIVSKNNLPERYQVACARHLDQYLKMVKGDILETSEKESVLEKETSQLNQLLGKGDYLPHIKVIYDRYFLV